MFSNNTLFGAKSSLGQPLFGHLQGQYIQGTGNSQGGGPVSLPTITLSDRVSEFPPPMDDDVSSIHDEIALLYDAIQNVDAFDLTDQKLNEFQDQLKTLQAEVNALEAYETQTEFQIAGAALDSVAEAIEYLKAGSNPVSDPEALAEVLSLTNEAVASIEAPLAEVTGAKAKSVEMLVNTETEGRQQDPAITVLEDGGYVIAYETENVDENGMGIALQRYDADGNKVGREVLVNSSEEGNQQDPSIAATSDGGYVVMWEDTRSDNIHGQKFAASGKAVGDEFTVNTNTSGNQTDVKVASLDDGGYVAVYTTDDGEDGRDIMAQRFDAEGNKVGEEILVNTETEGTQQEASVTGLVGGGYVVTYEDRSGADGSGNGVFAQVFDASGAKTGEEIQVNQTTSGSQQDAVVTALSDGDFVIAFKGKDSSSNGIYLRRFDASGQAVTDEIQVNTLEDDSQSDPVITATADGGYLIAFESRADEYEGRDIVGQKYDANNSKVGEEFLINETTSGDQHNPVIAATSDGFVAAYHTADSNSNGVYVKKYTEAGPDDLLTNAQVDNILAALDAPKLGETAQEVYNRLDNLIEDLDRLDTNNPEMIATIQATLQGAQDNLKPFVDTDPLKPQDKKLALAGLAEYLTDARTLLQTPIKPPEDYDHNVKMPPIEEPQAAVQVSHLILEGLEEKGPSLKIDMYKSSEIGKMGKKKQW